MNSIISSNSGVTAESAQRMAASSSFQPSPNRKLPYQATHQVELMHLEAETEALLQHLQALKQRRQIVQNVSQPAGQLEPALAMR